MRLSENIAIVGSGQIGLSSAYDCHVYAVRGSEGIVLIDTGSGLGERNIRSHLETDFSGVPVRSMLLTHAHADHAAGARAIQKAIGCEVISGAMTKEILEAADEESNGLARARNSGSYPLELKMEPIHVDRVVHNGQRFMAAGVEFTAIIVRGHSDDSLCFLADVDGMRVLFAGDVVFYGGLLGVINSHDSGMRGYYADLPRLQDLAVDALLPSHGLFTLKNGQRHITAALKASEAGFLPRQIGQGDLVF